MNTLFPLSTLSALALGLSGCAPMAAPGPETPRGKTIYGVSSAGELVRFGSDNAAASLTRQALSGLPAGDRLVGLDYSATDGKFYAVSSGNRVYTLDPSSAALTAIGSAPFAPALSGTAFGMDFNPVANRIRMHSVSGQNLRLNQTTGAVVDGDPNLEGIQTDTLLSYVAGDPGAGSVPALVGTAYTNNVAGATSTELYAIDSARDTLVKVTNFNAGTVQTVGALGVNTGDSVGFDIAADGQNFAVLSPVGANASGLYRLDLSTGSASKLADLAGVTLSGITVAP